MDSALPPSKTLLVAQPSDVDLHTQRLYDVAAAGDRGTAGVEIALWDLIGKVAGQPLYKFWGGGREQGPTYASQLRLSTVEEPAEQAER